MSGVEREVDFALFFAKDGKGGGPHGAGREVLKRGGGVYE